MSDQTNAVQVDIGTRDQSLYFIVKYLSLLPLVLNFKSISVIMLSSDFLYRLTNYYESNLNCVQLGRIIIVNCYG